MAKLLKQNGIDIGASRLFTWLRENAYLIKRKGTDWNMPTQKSMELQLFEIKETSIAHSDGHTSISKTPKITGKGQLYFIINLFLRSGRKRETRRHKMFDYEQMMRQIIREELSAALRNIPQYVGSKTRCWMSMRCASLIGRSKSWISQNKDSLPTTVYEGSRKWLKSDILEWMEDQKKQTEKKIVNFRTH